MYFYATFSTTIYSQLAASTQPANPFPPIHLSFSLPIHSPTYLPIHPSIYTSTYLPIYLPIPRLFTYPPLCPWIQSSICFSNPNSSFFKNIPSICFILCPYESKDRLVPKSVCPLLPSISLLLTFAWPQEFRNDYCKMPFSRAVIPVSISAGDCL